MSARNTPGRRKASASLDARFENQKTNDKLEEHTGGIRGNTGKQLAYARWAAY